MIDQKVIDFINEKLKKGLKKEEISKELLSHNWSKRDIKENFAFIESGRIPIDTGIVSIVFIMLIQTIIIIYNFIFRFSGDAECQSIGCQLGIIYLVILSLLALPILSIIGTYISNKKIKLYILNNMTPISFLRFVKLFLKFITIAYILMVILFLHY